MMKIVVLSFLALASLMACAVCCRAQEDRGYWRAASSNALAITGDINVGELKLTLNFATFPLSELRRLKPTEVSAVFDADVNAGINGTLYRVKVPATKYIVKKNTLCGEDETEWMATYVVGRNLQVAFFSGDDEPVFSFDAVQKSTALCGTFVYAR
jgi:hypothetical protein